uniref:Hepcidin antimicrobial peptide n=1 Tax=Equus asinus TaxID=9793 RepID=A0A9L0IPH7_EQUAS
MALNTNIRAACLLLLLLASLTSGSVLPHQESPVRECSVPYDLEEKRRGQAKPEATTRQLADLQTQDTAGMAGAAAGLMPGLHQLRRRDTHFPICTLCCGCCNKQKCGWCCKT